MTEEQQQAPSSKSGDALDPGRTSELVPGWTVRDKIRGAPSGMPIAKALKLAITLAKNLGEGHAQGVVHGDLEPDILFVDIEGNVSRVDREDTTGGTAAAYGAPELAEEGAEVTPATDVFSLGVIIYEMLTGQHPFAEASSKGTVIPPSVHSLGVPRVVDALVLRCLAADPGDRYPDASKLAEELERVEIAPPRKPLWPWLVGGGVFLLLAAVAVGIGAPGGATLRTTKSATTRLRFAARGIAGQHVVVGNPKKP